MKKDKDIKIPDKNIYKYCLINPEESSDLRKNNITNRIQSTNGRSGLAYLEYWIHNGIDESENKEINAVLLFVVFNAIKYEVIKQRKEERILGSLTASSLFPNNLIDNAINQ